MDNPCSTTISYETYRIIRDFAEAISSLPDLTEEQWREFSSVSASEPGTDADIDGTQIEGEEK